MKKLLSIVLVLAVAFMAVDASAKKPLKAKCKKDHAVDVPSEVLSVTPLNATSINITNGNGYDDTGAVFPNKYQFTTPGFIDVEWNTFRVAEDLYKCADYDLSIIGQYGTVTVRVYDWNGNVSTASIQAEM